MKRSVRSDPIVLHSHLLFLTTCLVKRSVRSDPIVLHSHLLFLTTCLWPHPLLVFNIVLTLRSIFIVPRSPTFATPEESQHGLSCTESVAQVLPPEAVAEPPPPLPPLLQPASVRVFLRRLESAVNPDEDSEQQEDGDVWDEGHGLEGQGVVVEAAVHHGVARDERSVGGRVQGHVSEIEHQQRRVVGVQTVLVKHRVDSTGRVGVLAVLHWLEEYLVLPHVQIKQDHEKQNPVIEPFA